MDGEGSSVCVACPSHFPAWGEEIGGTEQGKSRDAETLWSTKKD